ncbi:MAG: SDR family oxidoreductase [Pleurocapsa sp. SU_196_0]|nr:SDR family oxidoreductase [Pleurocapsa sp. SU_196_0]
MRALVVGANGATGRLLVKQLLSRGVNVKAIVRSAAKLPDDFKTCPNLSVIQASLLDLSDAELTRYTHDCATVASCLGHNMTLKGMFGHPRRLVTDATRRLCEDIKSNSSERPVRFVLMNTTGNSNRDIPERVSPGHALANALMRALLPPHRDNEQAADYLRTEIGQKDQDIQWVAVRPDSLQNANEVTTYEVHPSPTRSAIFNPGVTSRINTAHFMANLMTDGDLWDKWRGQMPVIYNATSEK